MKDLIRENFKFIVLVTILALLVLTDKISWTKLVGWIDLIVKKISLSF